MKRKSYFLILIAVMALASCKKDEPVPFEYFNFKEITFNLICTKCAVQCTIETDIALDGIVLEYDTDSLFTDVQQVPMTEVSSILARKQYKGLINGLELEQTYYFRLRVSKISVTSACQSFTTIKINPDAVIYYRSPQKLSEVTEGKGLRVDAFEIPIERHEYLDDGEGIIVFRDAITSIGNNAFYGCTGLTSVTIPNSITNLGNSAFEECTGLHSFTIPNSVTTIGTSSFNDCSSLTSITIPNSVINIKNSAFCGCSSLTSITIPNSVTSIGNYAFEKCTGLRSFTIPNSVTTIGISTFNGCSSLAYVMIPNSVINIKNSAFNDCSSLTSITIPNSITSIGGSAFSGCSNLVTIVCQATTPPTCYGYTWDKVSKSIPVYVPSASVNQYKAAYGWQEFTNIRPY